MAKYRKLSRTSSQRKALLRGLVTDLLHHGRIKTTEAKAKEVRKIAEHLIQLFVHGPISHAFSSCSLIIGALRELR